MEKDFTILKFIVKRNQCYYIGRTDSADDKDYEAIFLTKRRYDKKSGKIMF